MTALLHENLAMVDDVTSGLLVTSLWWRWHGTANTDRHIRVTVMMSWIPLRHIRVPWLTPPWWQWTWQQAKICSVGSVGHLIGSRAKYALW